MPARIIRDSQGRILHYHATTAPSQQRLRDILRQSEKAGAKRVGLVERVDHYAGSDSYSHRHPAYGIGGGVTEVRSWNGRNSVFISPAAMRARLDGPGSLHATQFLIEEQERRTGGKISGLQAFDLNFIYPN